MTSIVSATLPGVETPNKNQPHKDSNVSKAFFVDREVKKLRALGTRLPTKVDILKVYYHTSKTTTSHQNYE